MAWFFGFFLVSGFSSLVYEVVWLRLAMAQFGVTTALVSIVLSTFMAGLALGSWGAGRIAARFCEDAKTPIRLYAIAELAIATSAILVPILLAAGRERLQAAAGATWGSALYHAGSGVAVAVALLPFCLCIGATLPLGIAAIGRLAPARAALSFSYLYLANVVGAAAGTLVSAFVLIELLGFSGTLLFAAALNACLALAAVGLSLDARHHVAAAPAQPAEPPGPAADAWNGNRLLGALFLTGLLSLGMEVVWVRQFTPYLGNVVYTFALILAPYLVATAVGSRVYRGWALKRSGGGIVLGPTAWGLLGALALLPLAAADPRVYARGGVYWEVLGVLVGVAPFCAALGFVTPLLMDRWARGEPQRAGLAYAANVVGCILGPLLAGFVLLPAVGERWALFVLALPLFVMALSATGLARAAKQILPWGAAAVLLLAATVSFEDRIEGALVRRDATATVTAFGGGMGKQLLVNGVGMTVLTPITKLMAHAPMAWRATPPRRVLIVCFGMGTSFRSALSWGAETTSVDLVPSVPRMFGYFHADAQRVLGLPNARIVVDDGRRFLERTPETYDVIVIDPPPPVEAAGSSLLYSREFYRVIDQRLAPGGVLQQWIPGGEDLIVASFVRTVMDAFPHVRAFVSIKGWGVHVLASREPLPDLTAAALAARLPAAAAQDLVEWGPADNAQTQMELFLKGEIAQERLAAARHAPVLHDDYPINEYYFLRRTFGASAPAKR